MPSHPSSAAYLANLLDRGYREDPWHGPPTAELLRDLDAHTAAARPVAEGHSIWELVLHMTGWQGEVQLRLGGASPTYPAEGDWPEVGEPSEERWQAARAALKASTERLQAAIAALTEDALDRRVGVARDRPLGAGVTLRDTILGIVQHNAYHSGQIALLRRALGV